MTTPRRNEVMNVAAQAADWLRIIRAGHPQQDAAFIRWLKESPLHVRETLLACKVDEQLQRMDPERKIDLQRLLAQVSTNVLPMAARVAAPAQLPRRRRRWFAAAAACAAMATTALVVYQQVKSADGATFSTGIGEQRTLALDDGSIVYLNTRSRMRVQFDPQARDIYLEDGQALFEVQRDPQRPFRVRARNAVIQALGTQFDVRRYADRVTVAVVEGAVKVLSDGDPARAPAFNESAPKLKAGEAATITENGGAGPVVAIDAGVATAWRQQQLVFENAPLTQIVSEFNRYNRTPRLRVEGEDAGALRFNGVFNARNPESLLAYLQKHSAVTYERRGEEVVLSGK